MNPANPKLAPDADQVISGFGDLWLNGTLRLVPRGQYPGWLQVTQFAYLDPDGFLTDDRGARLFSVPFNTVAMGGRNWIATNTAQQTTYTSGGLVVADSYCPAMSPNGASWAYLTSNNELIHGLIVNGVERTRDIIDDKLSLTDSGAVVYSVFEHGLQQTWGCRPGAQPERLSCTYQDYEVDPVVVQLPTGELWVISHDDSRTLVRPWGSSLGYALPGAKTPHAMAVDATHLRVVGDLETHLLDVTLDLSVLRTDLSKPPVVEPPPVITPLPPGTVIADTLPYVVGSQSRWPRRGEGDTNMDCVPVGGQDAIAWVKFASSSFCEWWRWDGDFIYHHEDRSDGLDQPYHFGKDQWVRRRWAVGDIIDSKTDNWLFRTDDNGVTWHARPWAMELRCLAAFDVYPCGGDIGPARVFVMEYDATYTLEPRRGYVERFWFAEHWGWWRWQSFKFGTTPPDFSPPVAATADVQARAIVRRFAMENGRAPLVEDSELLDGVWNLLGGVRVQPISPVRLWPGSEPEPPEPPMAKPYDEQFYLNTAAPMATDDPSGACNQAIADYGKMGRPVDGQYSIWFTRTEHDYQGGMTLPASWKKHRNEMRALLDPSGASLPPFP